MMNFFDSIFSLETPGRQNGKGRQMSVTDLYEGARGVHVLAADAAPRWRVFMRALLPLRVIAQSSLNGPYTPAAFLSAIRRIHHEALISPTIQAKPLGLWQLEKLGYTYCRQGAPTLDDPAIPSAAQPILHIGLGAAATACERFNPVTLTTFIDARAHPDYRLLPYESIGCIWALYASRGFRLVFQLVSRFKLPACDLPRWSDFIEPFPPHIQRLMAHGYGRMLYFKHVSIDRAIREALMLEALDITAAAQGIAFAYVMLNHRDLRRILEAGQPVAQLALREAFSNGVIYALAFWEWAYPGFLDRFTPAPARQIEWLSMAYNLAEESRLLGHLPIFGIPVAETACPGPEGG